MVSRYVPVALVAFLALGLAACPGTSLPTVNLGVNNDASTVSSAGSPTLTPSGYVPPVVHVTESFPPGARPTTAVGTTPPITTGTVATPSAVTPSATPTVNNGLLGPDVGPSPVQDPTARFFSPNPSP